MLANSEIMDDETRRRIALPFIPDGSGKMPPLLDRKPTDA
jgi:hypothetical protein